jgi:uncharacterized membrane protein
VRKIGDAVPGDAEREPTDIPGRGATASFLLVASGMILSFFQDGGYRSAGAAALAGPQGSYPRTASWFLAGIAHLRGEAVVVAGLVLLIATPFMAVALSMIAFFRQRDLTYAAISAVVLVLLILSFALGGSG